MDLSENILCIKCDEGGNLLVCSENSCPLAIHEACMGCPARFDDAGRFYCPYCLYKKAVAESRQARENAMARKKDLLIFIDEEPTGGEKHLGENKSAKPKRQNQSKVRAANVNMMTCDDSKRRRNSGSVLDQPIQLDKERKISDTEEEKIEEEEPETSAGSEGQDPSFKMHEDHEMSNGEEGRNQEEETSAASTGQDPSFKMHEDHEMSNGEEGRNKEEETSAASTGQDPSEECETSSASTEEDPSFDVHTRAKRGSERIKPKDRDSKAVSVKRELVKQSDTNEETSGTVNPLRRSSRRSSSSPRTDKVLNEKVDDSRRLKQPQQPSVKLANDTFGSGKRKRLLWREEEEEMLEAGVQKYSAEANKNLPWRKILHFGREVFDGTRSPSDLKDKWRNMLAK